MPSSWIVARPTKPDGRNKGRPRYRVVYPLAGSGSPHHYGGSFATEAEALERKKWVDGELAGLRGEEIAGSKEFRRRVRRGRYGGNPRKVEEELKCSRLLEPATE